MIGTESHPITLVELETYARDADVVFTPDRHERLKEILAFNPEHGDVIEGTGGVRQFIWEIEDGTAEEVQVVYFFHDLDIPLFLVAICRVPFEEFDEAICAELKVLAAQLVDEYQKQKDSLIQAKNQTSA